VWFSKVPTYRHQLVNSFHGWVEALTKTSRPLRQMTN
jgi:hypothetical protein